ncbi:CDAN1-interacting nuclease 1-like [Physella acuta]|uniref:CDAN1-interacting nuclease 1-like n=1 Tax=Physella acuta TaxID=109671 RepID=UPI0027DE1F94|nr:CDAN1-interacting nuclease 1-like [Physella acuta]
MKQKVYDGILEILSREPSFIEGRRNLEKKWPAILETVSEKTLKSIQAQYYVRRMRRCHHHHYSRETRERYFKLYKEAKANNEKNVIMRLAAKNDISPCLLARIILEEYYWNDVDHGRERGEGRGSLPPGFMTDCIRDIAKLPNPELAQEIYETTVLDNFYGPAVDSIKKTCGVEYEMILKSYCKSAGLSFIDEDQMREDGYDKTPDIKLQLPILINNRVVNWIESKASFGDPINHQQYMIDQFLPYKNRFGPGAVIYWFGFVDELAELGERGILLLDKFPTPGEITHLRDAYKEDDQLILKHLSLEENCSVNDQSEDSVTVEDKFYNYVDPMFDSDEDDDPYEKTKKEVMTLRLSQGKTSAGHTLSEDR